MRLYHFTSEKYGLCAIRNRRLKIARIRELNDPFEFLGWNLQDPETRTKIRKWKDKKHKNFGILCFSSTWRNPLLWGHYADKFKGMALGFDVPDDGFYRQVEYCETRQPSVDLDNADVSELMLTKSSGWEYESEYRRFCCLAESICDGGLYFEPFSETLTLAEVIVGGRAEISRAELDDALGDLPKSIKRFKARPSFREFRIVQNLRKSLWK